MRPLLPVVALSLCCSGALLAQADQAPADQAPADQPQVNNRLKLELLLDMESVGGARMAPFDQEIVFTRRWVNKLEDRSQSALWIMNTDGSKPRFLTEGGSPR